MPVNEQTYDELRHEVERLREEQQRLRDEQDKLRRSTSDGEKHGEPQDQHKGGGKPDDGDQNKEQKEEQKEKRKDPWHVRAMRYISLHPLKAIAGALILAALILGGFLWWRYLESYESTDDAVIDGHLSSIGARINGTVVGVYFEENQFVRAGQLLVELDPRDYELALDQAKAAHAQAQAQVTAANPNVPITQTTSASAISTGQADVRAAEAAVSAAQHDFDAKVAGLRQAEAQNVKAQNDVKRYQLLVSKDEISQEQFDAVVAAAKSQAASVDAARAAADASRRTVDQRSAELQQATTRLAETQRNAPRQLAIRQADVVTRQANAVAAKAQVDAASLSLSYTRIYAPVSGVIAKRSVEVGQRIQPGQELCLLSEITDLWVTANFKETQLRQMHPGQSADISVDAFGTTYHGYIEAMPAASGALTSLLPPENATGNYVKVVQRLPVRIRFKPGEDPNHRLRPGMSVEPKVWLY